MRCWMSVFVVHIFRPTEGCYYRYRLITAQVIQLFKHLHLYHLFEYVFQEQNHAHKVAELRRQECADEADG